MKFPYLPLNLWSKFLIYTLYSNAYEYRFLDGRDGDRSGGRQGIGSTKVIVAVTVFITAVVAIFYLATRTAVPKGTLLVEYGGRAQELPLDRLELAAVQGTVVNGRGEERTVDAQSILLAQILRETGIMEFSEVTVTAGDEYSARVLAKEIAEPEKVYLIRQDEGGMQLIVLGNGNSKRHVSNVARLSVQ